MGRSFFHKLIDDDSDEDEIIIKLLMGSTPQRKHRRYIERNHFWQAIEGFMMTILPKNLYILPTYFEGDFE